MKLRLLILSVMAAGALTVGCSSSDSSSDTNLNRPRRADSPAANSQENSVIAPVSQEVQARVRQKAQEFVAENYAGWTLKGTSDVAKSPVDLHLVKDGEEKVVKVNYKEYNDLNGQPYIVLSKIAENDLSEKNQEVKPTPPAAAAATSTPEPRNEKTPAPSPSL